MAEDESYTAKSMYELIELKLSIEYAKRELRRLKQRERLMRKIQRRKPGWYIQ